MSWVVCSLSACNHILLSSHIHVIHKRCFYFPTYRSNSTNHSDFARSWILSRSNYTSRRSVQVGTFQNMYIRSCCRKLWRNSHRKNAIVSMQRRRRKGYNYTFKANNCLDIPSNRPLNMSPSTSLPSFFSRHLLPPHKILHALPPCTPNLWYLRVVYAHYRVSQRYTIREPVCSACHHNDGSYICKETEVIYKSDAG